MEPFVSLKSGLCGILFSAINVTHQHALEKKKLQSPETQNNPDKVKGV